MLVLCFFTASTFFTSLTLLNMVIAIMGDIFAEYIEHKEVNSIKTKLAILSELGPVIGTHEKEEVMETMMLVVQPVE